MTAVGTKGQNTGAQTMSGLTTAAASMNSAQKSSKSATKAAKTATTQTNSTNNQTQAMIQQRNERLINGEAAIQQQRAAAQNAAMTSPLASGSNSSEISQNKAGGNNSGLSLGTSKSVIDAYKENMGSYGKSSSLQDDEPPKQPQLGLNNTTSPIQGNDDQQKKKLNGFQMRK